MRTIQERMAEIKAAQEAGTYTRCPRCGEETMKLGDRLHTNALSRSYDIMICDLCGTDEAKMAFMDYEALVVGQVTAVAEGFCAAAVQQGVFNGLAVKQRPQAVYNLGLGDAFFVFVHGVSPSGLCALLI